MRTFLNLLWFLFGGFLIFFGYLLGGIFFCLTLIGIPMGLQSFKLAGAALAPFGKEVEEAEGANSVLRILLNVVWIVLPGLELALAHLVLALLTGITIIGLPFARQHLKMVPLALMPFGRRMVPVD